MANDEARIENIVPPEIWEHIFGYLTGLQVLRARLVCRHWRDIIAACPPLLHQFRIRFRNTKFFIRNGTLAPSIDDSFCPPRLLRVSEVIFQYYSIETLNSWWSWVAQKMTHLTLISGLIELSLLFSMLQQAPNLRILELRRVCISLGFADDDEYEEPNVHIDQLQVLILAQLRTIGDRKTCLKSIFEKIFPRIKDLRINNIKHEGFYNALLPAIRPLTNTLEALEVDDTVVNVRRDFPEITRWRRVSVHIGPRFNWNWWSRFFRAQSLIEDLVIFIHKLQQYDKVLHDIGRAVPKLKRLTLSDTDGVSTNFLRFMPNLERFELVGYERNGALLCPTNPSCITELHLEDVEISDFWNYLDHSPQLRSIVLVNCSILSHEEPSTRVLKNLRTLKVSKDATVPRSWIRAMLRKCPCVEELQLECGSSYKDSLVLLACERLRRLRKLSLEHCPVSEAVVEHIVRKGLALEEVRFDEGKLSEAAVERLRATRGMRVCVTID